jgi:hypothetical protein
MGKQTELTKITSLVHGCDRPSMVASDTRRRIAALFPLTTEISRGTARPSRGI